MSVLASSIDFGKIIAFECGETGYQFLIGYGPPFSLSILSSFTQTSS
jgi:hypothetical protein